MLRRLERAYVPLLLLIVLAAFGLRVLGLGIQDLSDDEAFFVQIAHQGTYLQLAGSTEPHPPLYLALLQGWMFPAGVTEFAVRFLSVLFGVATVAAAYQLGREVAGKQLGLAAAAVAALNPYQIFYSQTARDYEIACFFGLVSMVALLLALRRPRWIPAYVASALLAIFSHYYALAIVLFEQALLLGWLQRRHFKGLRRWLAADGCLALVFLPWALYSLRTVAAYEPGHGSAAIVRDTLRQTFQFYNFGTAFRPADVVWPTIVVAALTALGLWGLAQAGGGRALGLSVGYQLAPVVFGLATLLHTTQFGARFLFLGSPGYVLVIAGAMVLLARWWALVLVPVAVLSGLAGFAIHNTTFSDQFTDKAYSRLAAYLANHIAPNDAVVLNGISQSLQYWYYGQLRDGIRQRVAILPLKADGGGADGSPVDLGQTRRALDQLTSASSGIWLIDDDSLRYDPNLDTQRMLADEGFHAFSQSFRGQRLDFYALGSPGPLAPLAASFEGVRLAQASRLDHAVPAGHAIPLRLEWQATRDDPSPFKESLRLVDASGGVLSQDDGSPGAGFWPSAWPAGVARRDQPGLLVPVGTPPGAYRLDLVAYDATSGKPLGAPVELQPVKVDHSAPQRISAAGLAPASAAAGGERLVGLAVPPQVAAGEKLPVSLLWSGGPSASAASVSLSLGGRSVDHQVGGAAYPTTAWRQGDVVRDVTTIRVPASLASGEYPLLLGQTRLASVWVLPTTRLFSAPPVAHASDWRFGDVAQLLGWQLDPTPAGVRVRLIWKALSEGDVSYTAFVHALGPDGKVAAQVDRPLGTDNWDLGEVVPADYELAVSGSYTLELGLYDVGSGARLPVCAGDTGCSHPADHVNLAGE